MYKKCQTEQSAVRQLEMETGLLRMMLRKHYDEISVTDLCRDMQIPRKAFYRYFSDKDSALQSAIDHAIMDFDSYASLNGVNDIAGPQQYMEKVLGYWVTHKFILDALSKSNLSGLLVHRAILYSQEQNAMPYFLSNMDRKLRNYGTMFAVCGLMSIIIQWHSDGFTPDISQLSQVAIRLLSEPLFHTKS
ncbi:MAG: TetR/AcrR family transcriptional regulator [Oscillospiraceae bacterium]|nr:TetR/AcrR family transcriptional regulator [Oscillospiraceae bacterium]